MATWSCCVCGTFFFTRARCLLKAIVHIVFGSAYLPAMGPTLLVEVVTGVLLSVLFWQGLVGPVVDRSSGHAHYYDLCDQTGDNGVRLFALS